MTKPELPDAHGRRLTLAALAVMQNHSGSVSDKVTVNTLHQELMKAIEADPALTSAAIWVAAIQTLMAALDPAHQRRD